MDIDERIGIAAAPERVWSVMIDVERWPEWTPSVTSVERLDAGSVAVGSRVRIRQPRLPAAVWTVITLQPGSSFEWQNASPGVRSVAGHRLTDRGDGNVDVALSLRWTGPLAPLLRLLFGKLSRRYVQLEAEGLKRRCEAADPV